MASSTTTTASAPKTSEYRVRGLFVSYFERVTVPGPNGDETVLATRVGRFGETIQLDDAQAKRIKEHGTIVAADAPLGYDEMDDDQLDALIKERGVPVSGTGANGAVLTSDRINALNAYDAGVTAPGA